MPGRSTIDQIFALLQIIEKCNEHNRTLYIAFVDFKAAFDSIDRISLWDLVFLLTFCFIVPVLVLVTLQCYFTPAGQGSVQWHISGKSGISAFFNHDEGFLRHPGFPWVLV